jgi:hypothetical protein
MKVRIVGLYTSTIAFGHTNQFLKAGRSKIRATKNVGAI